MESKSLIGSDREVVIGVLEWVFEGDLGHIQIYVHAI